MILVLKTKVQNPSVIYEDNQGAFFLANNRQVGIFTNNIDICHNILRDMVEYKGIDISIFRLKITLWIS